MDKQFPPKNIARYATLRLIISDMKVKMDRSQFANQTGLSIQHYLIKSIDRILEALDQSKSKSCVVLANLVNWKQTFPCQCRKLGNKSIIKSGFRPALISTFINYFQGRQMKVKWHVHFSSP